MHTGRADKRGLFVLSPQNRIVIGSGTKLVEAALRKDVSEALNVVLVSLGH